MCYKNDLQTIQSRKQHRLSVSFSSQRASSSIRTWHSRLYSSTSYSGSSRSDADSLDPLDDIALDIDLDQRSTSSATLLSRRVSSSLSSRNKPLTDAKELESTPSDSHQSFLYPLREPGQMTAQHTQRLRARTAAVIMSIPATCEDVTNVDDDHEAVRVPPSKLRRVSGVKDLRRAFRDGDHASTSIPLSKGLYELGILATPIPPLPPLSPRSSLSTLVDVGNSPPQTSGDVKTLCESTSSISISSRFSTKLRSTFSPSRKSRAFLPIDAPQPIVPGKCHVRNLSTARSRHTSLNLDTPLSRSPGESVWSCAKISQSSVKRAARRGHTPRRVFSNPITVPSI